MLNIIEAINNAKPSDKITIMEEHPQLKTIVEYAYNPFKKFHLTIKMESIEISGEDKINLKTFDLLDKLYRREVTGHKAVELLKGHLYDLDKDNQELLKRIIGKDLRAGISLKTINKAYPDLIPLVYDGSAKPPIALVRDFEKHRYLGTCMAGIKVDGVRGRSYFKNLISRQGHPFKGLDHITDFLKKYDINFDGEIAIPGMNFDEATGRIRDSNPTPEAVYHIFDAPDIGGKKSWRYEQLQRFQREVYLPDFIKIIPQFFFYTYDGLIAFYESVVDSGGEGIVIYDPDSYYQDGKSWDWMRMVPLKTGDFLCCDFYEGKGKYENTLGGIIVLNGSTEIKVGSGFQDRNWNELSPSEQQIEGSEEVYQTKTRSWIWDNQDECWGFYSEVEFKQITAKGSLRHPSFKRWRKDK